MWLLTCRVIRIVAGSGAKTEELLGLTYRGGLPKAISILAARSRFENAKPNGRESVYYVVVGATRIPRLDAEVISAGQMEKIEDLIPPGFAP